MRQALKLHPDFRCTAVTSIEVDVTRQGDMLVLLFLLTGRTQDLRVPALAAPERTDELWKHTCFEAFVHTPNSTPYYEFNFSPSTQWAAYRFTNYRQGMCALEGITAPRIDVRADPTKLSAHITLNLRGSGLLPDAPWQVGLTAVLEETNGNKSFWAIAHPAGKPDFHHLDGFVLDLPAVERT
jgi:hypothetical protein